MQLISFKTSLRSPKQTSSRSVWKVVLLGDPRVGKSALVGALLQTGKQNEMESETKSTNIVEITFPNGETRRVIFHEVQTMD